MNNWKWLIWMLAASSLAACETQEDLQAEVEALIEQRVEERRSSFIATIQKNCERDILEEATRIVDSIIIAEARLKKDTLPKPPRPDRPEVPELKQLKDTSPVSPLFRDSLILDTANLSRKQGKKN
jgi:hypothetical protein